MTRALPAGACADNSLLGRSALPPKAAAPCKNLRRDRSPTPVATFSCGTFPTIPPLADDQHLFVRRLHTPVLAQGRGGHSADLPSPHFQCIISYLSRQIPYVSMQPRFFMSI